MIVIEQFDDYFGWMQFFFPERYFNHPSDAIIAIADHLSKTRKLRIIEIHGEFLDLTT
jgi:hypothetical protein